MIETRLIHISGQVQGVGFRAFTARVARKGRISGHARNLETGDVEVIAHGEGKRLDRFEIELQDGPSAASVNNLASKTMRHSGAVSGFLVLY